VWASSREELFAEAGVALISVMGEAQGDPAREFVSIDASDDEALFVDWLSEILFLFEARRFVPTEVKITIEGTRLDANIGGVTAERFDQTGPAIKAVTFHGLELAETDARVYVDV